MKRFVAIYFLCLLFLPLHGQEVFGYYRCPSSNVPNSQWNRVSQNDTVLSVSKQKGRLFTKYVILYHDIKVEFKIENIVILRLDSIGVHLEKLPPPHSVTFWWFPTNNDPKWGVGCRVPGTIPGSKSTQINIFPKPEYSTNCPLKASRNALVLRKRSKRIYVYVERRGKGKYIKVSHEKAIRIVENEYHPGQP